MSVSAVNWALGQPVRPGPKLVLVVICEAANCKQRCWPSQAWIAKRASMKRQLANRYLKELIDDGYVEIVGRGKVLTYQPKMMSEICNSEFQMDAQGETESFINCNSEFHGTIKNPVRVKDKRHSQEGQLQSETAPASLPQEEEPKRYTRAEILQLRAQGAA